RRGGTIRANRRRTVSVGPRPRGRVALAIRECDGFPAEEFRRTDARPKRAGEASIVSLTQQEKAARFRALHDGPGAFVIPNPWDAGSARVLAGLGFEALATSSAASACAIGRKDGELSREEALAHARVIVGATDLPVSADLENGF